MQSFLKLHWKATFKDGSSISQFENDKENRFKLVKDNFSNLTSFSLIHQEKPLKITINLQKGFIYFNDNILSLEDVLITKKENIRLIFFRRNKIISTINNAVTKHEVIYFLGYQYLDITGRNKKVILQITQDGDMVIGG